MAGRDDFPESVIRLLAQRAGYRCSICNKSTIGPANTDDRVISDGIAAHITAASLHGPRYDQSLSHEERRSAENGIWACTQHGREIDSDISTYSVAALRGRKRIREESARKEMQYIGTDQDATASLIELPYTESPYELFEIIRVQPYTYPTTSAIRDQLRLSKSSSDLLAMASDIIINVWDSSPEATGILATLLSNNLDMWQPTTAILDKLQTLCEKEIAANDWSQMALTQPLAFALAAKGKETLHSQLLERFIENAKWREVHANRVRNYYSTLGVEIAAIQRHWQDPFRSGLLRAHDVGLVLDILLTSDDNLKKRRVYDQLIYLLASNAEIIGGSGNEKLARRLQDIVEASRNR